MPQNKSDDRYLFRGWNVKEEKIKKNQAHKHFTTHQTFSKINKHFTTHQTLNEINKHFTTHHLNWNKNCAGIAEGVRAMEGMKKMKTTTIIDPHNPNGKKPWQQTFNSIFVFIWGWHTFKRLRVNHCVNRHNFIRFCVRIKIVNGQGKKTQINKKELR